MISSTSLAAGIIALVLVVYSIVLHEVAHGYAAFLLGDGTAYRAGRLTFNPIRHIDPFYTIIMPLLLWVGTSGRFVFGGAKPVPVNIYNLRNPERDHMLVSLAGPGVNLSIMLLCCILLRVPFLAPGGTFNQVILVKLAMWNIWLALFNLIPVPPLDGSSVVIWLLPRDLAVRFASLRNMGMIAVFLVIVVFSITGLFGYMAVYGLWFVSLLSGIDPYVLRDIFIGGGL